MGLGEDKIADCPLKPLGSTHAPANVRMAGHQCPGPQEKGWISAEPKVGELGQGTDALTPIPTSK